MKAKPAKDGFIQLSESVKIRKEYFGGIVFHMGTGNTLEVDHETYTLLAGIREAGAADIRALARQNRVRDILPLLISMDVVEYTAKKAAASANDGAQPNLTLNHLSAPETVHLAVTWRCGDVCPDCYVRNYAPPLNVELNTTQMCGIVDEFADNGVFQLAVGGGEPFMRSDLFNIVGHAAGRNLAVHITTGKYELEPAQSEVLKYIKSLHVGIRSEELLSNGAKITSKLAALANHVNDAGICFGTNLILTRFTLRYIDKLMELLLQCAIKRYIFLRYKPIPDRERWNSENPNGDELRIFHNWLAEAKSRYHDTMMRIDCAAAFLMRDADPSAAGRAGIKGCTAGERIISVAPDGSVYPCSQLVGHAYNAGNLTNESFKTVWRESGVLNSYRRFRQSASFTDSVCGRCGAGSFCGGCRVFADNGIGGEPFCPLEKGR